MKAKFPNRRPKGAPLAYMYIDAHRYVMFLRVCCGHQRLRRSISEAFVFLSLELYFYVAGPNRAAQSQLSIKFI